MKKIDKLFLFFEGVNRCGFVIVLAMLYGILVWYGITHDIMLDVVFGGIFLGGCLHDLFTAGIEYMLDHEDDGFWKKKETKHD